MKYTVDRQNQAKTLLSRAAAVLQHFNERNQPAFSFSEVQKLLADTSLEAIKKLMRDMVKRGLLLRLKDGVYWIIPYEQDSSTYFPNTHLIAKYIIRDTDYYIGYYSALELHSLITQPSFREQVVVDKQVKPASIKILGHKFQFIYHNKDHFFGCVDQWVDSFNKVRCSDLEKTFIDCLFKPDYAGGITEIAKGLYKRRHDIDYEKMLEYCQRFKAQSVIKRLGFLLDLLQIDNPIMDRLKALRTESFILLEPTYEKKGVHNRKWFVQQNIENTEITSPVFS